MRTLLIAGGCGFIGSHFVRAALGAGTFAAVFASEELAKCIR